MIFNSFREIVVSLTERGYVRIPSGLDAARTGQTGRFPGVRREGVGRVLDAAGRGARGGRVGWQVGQKNVDRAPWTIRPTGLPQFRQGSPARS